MFPKMFKGRPNISNYLQFSQCSMISGILFPPCLVLGAGLVAQPTFIFGELSSSSTPRQEYYTLGAVLALFGAVAGGVFPVLMAKCKEVPSCFFMLMGGGVSLVVGVIHRTVMANPDPYTGRLIGEGSIIVQTLGYSRIHPIQF